MAHNFYLRQTWRYLRIFAGYGGFVTFVKSNAKALSTAVPSIKSTLAPSGGTETFTPVSLPEYIPNHHNTVSLQDTILLQDSFPFWSEPIHHQATLPGILHSEILYQSIDLMIIIHIFCYNCYILIFLLSLCQSPFIYRFRRGALNQGSLLKILFYASQLPTTPYQHSPCLLSTGA